MSNETAHTESETGEAHVSGEVHHHPGPGLYVKIGIILTLITVAEVWAYYIPSFVASRAFVPSLLIMSAVKFAIVVMFYCISSMITSSSARCSRDRSSSRPRHCSRFSSSSANWWPGSVNRQGKRDAEAQKPQRRR